MRRNEIKNKCYGGEGAKDLMWTGNVDIVLSKENRLNVPRKLRYTPLMPYIGRLLVIGKGGEKWIKM